MTTVTAAGWARRLDGEIAVVTGGAHGIGAAVARRLSAEGAAVAVLDVDDQAGLTLADGLRTAGAAAIFVHADVSAEAEVDAAVRTVTTDFGAPSILVNSAAWLHGFSSVTETAPADWDHAFGVNLRGAYLVSRAMLPHLVTRGGGAIVHIASVGAAVVFPQHAAYCAAKAGLVQLTRSIAVDYGAEGVRANAVLPGAIRTRHLEESIRDDDDRRRREAMSVLGRLGEPDEIAAAVAFLVSRDAGFVTGAALVVDGGWALR